MTTEDTVITPEIAEEILQIANKAALSTERTSLIVMLELVRARGDIFLLMRDDKIAKWWGAVVRDAKTTIERRRAMWQTYRSKMAVYERLTGEERRALGIRKPTKPTSVDPDTVIRK